MEQCLSFRMDVEQGDFEKVVADIKSYFVEQNQYLSPVQQEDFSRWLSSFESNEDKKAISIFSDDNVDVDVVVPVVRNMLYSVAEKNYDVVLSGYYSVDNDEYESIPHDFKSEDGKIVWDEVDDELVGQINMYLDYMDYSIEQVAEETRLPEEKVKSIAKALGYNVD